MQRMLTKNADKDDIGRRKRDSRSSSSSYPVEKKRDRLEIQREIIYLSDGRTQQKEETVEETVEEIF